MEWTFAVEGAPDEACLVWASTSTATGPRSRAYGYLTGLLGGKAPAVGQAFEAQDLVGRMAMITIRRDEEGWTKVENVGALPRRADAASAPATQAAASSGPAEPRVVPLSSIPSDPNGRPQTLREQVEQAPPAGDGLPF
jgi:hypothetical protein